MARALMLAPWVEHVCALGAPAEALLERAGIRPDALEHPEALVPLGRAFRWAELACASLGTEHLGLDVGRDTPVERLGGYGRLLARSTTLHQYLRQGVSFYASVVSGPRFVLSSHGSRVRIEMSTPWEPTLGDYQSQLNSLAITIASIRAFAGPRWAPEEIRLGFRAREPIPAVELLDGARIVHGPGRTGFELPRWMLALPRRRADLPLREPVTPPDPLPRDLAGLVTLQIEAWLADGTVTIDRMAGSIGLSRRSLQRGLAAEGATYAELLSEVRLRRATEWLEATERPILEIALELGYTDASNFTRAFRRWTGVSPQAFRRATGLEGSFGR